MSLIQRVQHPMPFHRALLLLAVLLTAPAAWCSDSGGSVEDTSLDDSFGGGGDVSLAIQYNAIANAAKGARQRAAESLAYANTFTCAAAAPYRAAAQTAANQANTEASKLDNALTIPDAKTVRDAASLAAAETTRNAHLAAQACGAPVPPQSVFSSPFDGLANPYPTWDSTFWDISSP
jgi:hypothetical protein